MYPKTRIIISKNGNSRIEGMEEDPQCYKLKELAESAGKVIEDNDKEHQPVHQDVNRRS